jgi:hypothetical protein
MTVNDLLTNRATLGKIKWHSSDVPCIRISLSRRYVNPPTTAFRPSDQLSDGALEKTVKIQDIIKQCTYFLSAVSRTVFQKYALPHAMVKLRETCAAVSPFLASNSECTSYCAYFSFVMIFP